MYLLRRTTTERCYHHYELEDPLRTTTRTTPRRSLGSTSMQVLQEIFTSGNFVRRHASSAPRRRTANFADRACWKGLRVMHTWSLGTSVLQCRPRRLVSTSSSPRCVITFSHRWKMRHNCFITMVRKPMIYWHDKLENRCSHTSLADAVGGTLCNSWTLTRRFVRTYDPTCS